MWSNNCFGQLQAIASVIAYAFLPIIVTNASLATTDFIMSAILLYALYAFQLWLIKPSFKNTLYLGVTFGLLCVSKFSGPLFFIILSAVLIITKDYSTRTISKGFSLAIIKSLLGVGMIAFFIIWAAYRFDTTTLDYPYFFGENASSNLKIVLQNLGASQSQTEYILKLNLLPFPEFFHGLADLSQRIHMEFAGYIFGDILKYSGVWYFYLCATLFKTPLPFILFTIIGGVIIFQDYPTHRDWKKLVPLVYFIILYMVSTTFNMNIGLRHILPVFFFASQLAGVGIINFIYSKKIFFRYFAIISSILFFSPSIAVDNISYFNLLAGKHPENILIDSDFDVGQELEFAAKKLKQKQLLQKTKLYFFAITEPKFFGIKDYKIFAETKNVNEYLVTFEDKDYVLISISLLKLLTSYQLNEINNCTRGEKIGQTFRLFKKDWCKGN